MTDDITLEDLQRRINRYLYQSVIECYKTAIESVDTSEATNAIVSGLATSLGVIIAQLPEQHKQEYIDISHRIINESHNEVTENLDRAFYGIIGHA